MLLWVSAGGFAGAVARYWANRAAARWLDSPFPWGTFAVNISGSFLLGLLAGLTAGGAALPRPWLLGSGTGFLGAYTTFSTWHLESLHCTRQGRPHLGLLNLLLSTGAGLAAAALGAAAGLAL